ncbi:MAG: acyltransferase [Clostridia bacterium]|nr:acyltransferase [Clostridia bacterium]
MSRPQRNCTIDLMRFVMTLSVVMVHMVTPYMDDMTILRGGTIAVEFFFILSGLLLASSAERADRSLTVWQSTWKTMKRKVSSIYPMWIIALVLRLAILQTMNRYPLGKFIQIINETTTSFLMLNQLGLPDSPGIILFSWYIPVMLLCTLILYPVLFTRRKAFTYTLCPLIVTFGCAYLFQSTGSHFTRDAWLGFTWSATVRGLSDMCLGVIAYETSRRLNLRFDGRLTRAGRTLFTVLEGVMLVYIFYYVLRFLYPEILLNLTLGFAVFLAVAYSGLSWSADALHGKCWAWLGQFSLAVYLAQGVPNLLLQPIHGAMNRWLFVLVYFAVTFAVAFLLWYGGKGLTCLYRKVKQLPFTTNAG